MEKTDISIARLVSMIEAGQLRLPELQRQYVWTAPRVRDLFDSLYRGYPSGTILVWNSADHAPEREMAVDQPSRPGWGGALLLLDGQQRLTSLAAIMGGRPLHVRSRTRPIDLAFNLEHPDEILGDVSEIEDDAPDPGDTHPEDDGEGEEADSGQPNVQERIRNRTFVVATKGLLADPHWIRVSEIFSDKTDSQLLKPLGITSDDPKWDLYTRRLQRVRAITNYQYVMNVLEPSLAYEEVAEIFVRVNSLGMKLRGSDLALAQITARWQHSLSELESFQSECESYWFNLDMGFFVRALVVFATRQSKFASVGRIPLRDLQSAWDQAKDGIRFALNFLRQNAGIENETLLSSPLFIISVAVYAMLKKQELTAEDQRTLLHWLLVANAFGHYTTSTESTLNADLAVLHRGGNPADLLELVKQQFGRVEFAARDFERRSARHGLFATTYLALRHQGARDWGSGLRIALTNQGRYHYIEWHHIFPRSVLSQRGVEKQEIDEIANMAFISGSKNRMLGSKTPDVYLPTIVESKGEQVLKEHAIPANPELWRVDAYSEFLATRRARLAEVVNGFLNGVSAGTVVTVDPVSFLSAGEGEWVEFKQTARLNVYTGEVDKALERAVVKTVAAFFNGLGGTLLIGVTDEGIPVGLDSDVETMTHRPTLDGYEQFLRQALANAIGTTMAAAVKVTFPVIEERTICMLQVPPAAKPVYVDGGKLFYLRSGNTTRELSMEEAHGYIQTRFK